MDYMTVNLTTSTRFNTFCRRSPDFGSRFLGVCGNQEMGAHLAIPICLGVVASADSGLSGQRWDRGAWGTG